MTDLNDLLERVREAKAPDRQLDVDLAWSLEPQRYAGAYWAARTGKPGTTLPKKLDGLGAIAVQRHCAEFSASIDAALALVERLLPGWRYDVHSPRFGTPFETVVMDGDSASRRIVVSTAATAPLAILAALLSALKEVR